MYEEPKSSPIATIIRFALFIIVVLAIVWIVVWFFFFRSNGTDTAKTTPKPATSQSDLTPKPSNPTNNSGQSTAPTAATPSPSPSASTGTATANGTLPSTGPGNILPLAAGWAVAGSAAYYIRLRRKVVRESVS